MSERLLSEDDESFPRQDVNALYIDEALRLLVPSGSRTALRAIFDNRVTFHAIHHWRHGRRALPIWARAAIERALDPYVQAQARLKKIPAPDYKPGAGLRHWRASKR